MKITVCTKPIDDLAQEMLDDALYAESEVRDGSLSRLCELVKKYHDAVISEGEKLKRAVDEMVAGTAAVSPKHDNEAEGE